LVEKNLVFVFENDNVEDFIKKNNLENNALVICNNYEIKENLSKMKLKCKMVNDYKLSENQITKSIEWLKSWPNKIIWNGKNFKEIFLYNEISLFWFLESRLYHKRIHELITLIEQVKMILSIEQPDKVWIIGDRDLQHIVSQLHVKIEYSKISNKQIKSTISDDSYAGFLTWKLFLLKIARGILSPKIKFRNKNNPVLFITEVGSWRKTYDYATKNYRYQDVFFHNIIKKLMEKGQPIEIIDFENRPARLLSSYSLNKKRIQTFKSSVEPWEKFLTFKIILKSKKAHQKFKTIWLNLKKSNEFKKSLQLDGISIYDIVKDDFEELFNSFKALAAIAMIETISRIVDIKRPLEIIMHDEYGAIQLSALYAAKKHGIPTLSLQHGIIYDDVFSYTHNYEDINNERKELNFALPDKMCVWSENAKEALINSAKFHPSALEVTGDPKMDFFKNAEKDYNRKRILKNANIPEGKKIILLATENLPNFKERMMMANAVLESMSNLSEFFLVIKMHPNESNWSIYEKIAKKFGITSYSILRDISLYELIHISELVIISYSTVALEAMRMLKPVISLNLMGLHNEASIIKNNLAIEVREKSELIPSILDCIKNKNEEKIKRAKIFAEQELGKIDGKVTDKIVSIILELKQKIPFNSLN